MSDVNKRWRKRNPEKARAHWMLGNAIRYGRMKRQNCEICGNGKSHAHHYDYHKPLEVEWLCHDCHWKRHGWFTGKYKGTKKRKIERRPSKDMDLTQQMRQLREQGKTLKEIGKLLNCCRQTVASALKPKE